MFSKVTCRRIRTFNIPEWLFLKAGFLSGKKYGFDQFANVHGPCNNKQMQLGRFDIQPSSVVKDLSGRDPENFETIAKANFQQSRYAKPTVVSWFKAFLRFNIMPLYPTPSKQKRALTNSW